MRTRLLFSIVCGLLATAAASLPANADTKWSGPGYYVVESDELFGAGLASGPYSNEADCKAAVAALPQQEQEEEAAGCAYEASDPDKS